MMIENYYNPEQLDYLKERREMLGLERIRQAENEWQELIYQARSAMQNDIDPTSETVQELALRSQELIQEFTGGDAGIERALFKFSFKLSSIFRSKFITTKYH